MTFRTLGHLFNVSEHHVHDVVIHAIMASRRYVKWPTLEEWQVQEGKIAGFPTVVGML